MNKEKTADNTVIVMGGNFLSLLLGLGTSVVVAAYFGLGQQIDAFMAAFMFPDILGQMLLSIAILLLVPTFIEYKARDGKNAAWEVMNKFITLSFLCLAGGTLSFMIFSSPLIKIVAPGFDSETHLLSDNLLRILSFSVLLFGLGALATSLLQAQKHFTAPAISRPVMQVFIILSLILLNRHLGIYAYAFGTVAGLLFALIVQLPPLLRTGRLSVDFDIAHPAIRSVLACLPPLIFARLLNHGTRVFINAVASTLAVGSISSLSFAWKLTSMPMLVTSSLSIALYPTISEEIAKKDFTQLGYILSKAIRVSIYIGAPFTVLFIIARVPIVRFLFERGSFTPHQSYLTAHVLMFYCIMIVFQSVNLLVGNTYWALRFMKLRLKIEAVAVLFCIALSLILSKVLGAAGLALSISGQYIFLMVIGLIILKKKVLINFDMRKILNCALKICIASVFMGLSLHIFMYAFSSFFELNLIGQIKYLFCIGLVAVVTYLSSCFLLRIKENEEILVLVKKKISNVIHKLTYSTVRSTRTPLK